MKIGYLREMKVSKKCDVSQFINREEQKTVDSSYNPRRD